jgi:alpha-D-ribose 1-methylphosphonate 5-triphosphate synthase subunit PhnH
MMHRDLSNLGAGFCNEALGSQAVFRAAMQALSHPGRVVAVLHDAQTPANTHSASAALLLALLDADCTLWLSESFASTDAALWLHFHTGCRIVAEPAQAQFVWVGQGDAMPTLASLNQGTDAYPDQSTTCVVDVATVQAGHVDQPGWELRGPGIQTQAHLQVQGVASDFLAQWADNHARFPRGVDVFLASATTVVGLPRTTHIFQQGGL